MNVLPAIRADHGSTLWYYCDPTKNSPSEGFLVMFNVESGSLESYRGLSCPYLENLGLDSSRLEPGSRDPRGS